MDETAAKMRDLGHFLIAGCDEAGRGPLAGPVFAAAVILGEEPIYGLNDSKRLSEKKREALYETILEQAKDYAIAQADIGVIETINILEATKLAMTRALTSLKKVDCALTDAVSLSGLQFPCYAIVKGDQNDNAIAAASILAKVTRDRLMRLYDKEFPGYGFAAHKGYGTKAHIAAIRSLGPCEIHRLSFLGNILKS